MSQQHSIAAGRPAGLFFQADALGWRGPAAAALLVVVTCLAYWPALRGGFILDDDLLLQNDLVKDPHGLYRMWFTADPIDYWPLSNSSLWFEWRLWHENPFGYHVTNLVIHIVVSLLVWAALRQLAIPGAFLGALLFAVHPVNVDSVAWISQRKTIMAMLFFLPSIMWYAKAELSVERRPWYQIFSNPWYWASLIVFVLGMLSKGSIATLPLVLLLVVWWQRDRIRAEDLLRTAPFFLIAVVLAIVNIRFQDHGGGPIRVASFAERLAAAGAVPWFYLYKGLLPIDLSFIYPLWKVDPTNLLWWLPLLGAVAFTALLWWRRHTWWGRLLLFAWLFFCIMLVPVLGFADVSYMNWTLVADHYQYISLMAVTAVVAAAWVGWEQRLPESARPAALVVAALVVAVLALLTWRQSELYRDPITLYKSAIAQNPACWQAHYNLGRLYFAEGRLQDTIDASEASVRYAPENALPQNNAMAYNNIGAALFNMGKPQEALTNLRKALELDPKLARAHSNLANVLFSVGEQKDAFAHYYEALSIWPSFDEAHINLGTALVESGRPQDAIQHFEIALRIQPNKPEALCNLGVALLNSDRPREAIERFEQALRIKPDFVRAHNNLAKALLKMGQTQQAFERYQQALRIDPNSVETHLDLGQALARMGRPQEAVAYFEQALRVKPDDARAHNDLGAALRDLGRPQEALDHFQRSAQQRPNYVEAWSNLAGTFAELQRYAESIRAAETALALARAQGRLELVQPLDGLISSLRSVAPASPTNIPNPALPPTP